METTLILPEGENKSDLIASCLKQQEVFGPYTTTHMSLLLIALVADNGIVNLFRKDRAE